MHMHIDFTFLRCPLTLGSCTLHLVPWRNKSTLTDGTDMMYHTLDGSPLPQESMYSFTLTPIHMVNGTRTMMKSGNNLGLKA